MKQPLFRLLTVVLLLVGCAPVPAPVPPAPTQTLTSSPTVTPELPLAVPGASTSPSPSRTASATPTRPATNTPPAWRYVFPIQPAQAADFAEGGHPYPATDLFALEGTHFVAVTDGVVDFVSYTDRWDPSTADMSLAGGLCVAILGDDGVRYYGSHLSTIASGIAPGVRVSAGQLLGTVGRSGNALGTPAHVHFGISHPTYPEDWRVRRGEIDPYPFLIAWLAGHAITPPLSLP